MATPGLRATPSLETTQTVTFYLLLKFKGIDMVTSHHSSIDNSFKSDKFPIAMYGINCLGFTLQAIWNKLNVLSTDLLDLDKLVVRMAN